MIDILIPNMGYKELNPLIFGYEDCNPGHSYGPALRSYWLIHFVTGGKGCFINETGKYNIEKNDLFVIKPFEKIFYQADSKAPWSYIWIGFECYETPPVKLDTVINLPEGAKIFEKMKQCVNMEGGRSAYLAGKLWELMSIIIERRNPPLDYVDNTISYIEAEYMHTLSVQDIAKRVNIDRSYLTNIFKNKTGLTPKQYIIKTRMERAAQLMVVYNQSPTIAAGSVGYDDFYNFSKMFKKYFGVSPREYKRVNSNTKKQVF